MLYKRLFFPVLNDIGYLTLKDKAQIIQRFGGHGFSVLDSVDRIGIDPLLVNQIVGRNAALIQCFP